MPDIKGSFSAISNKFKTRSKNLGWLEILAILLWVLWVGRAYLNFDPTLWPFGMEYGLSVRSHYVWESLVKCGTCVFWNGTVRGGVPSFAELQGGLLNPVVILSTLIAGVVNGSKLILLSSLFIAGLAQWWMAKRLEVGWIARLWSAGMAVVGGHLAGRMELGLVGVILSTAFCSLAIAGVVDLGLTGKRRSAIMLGIILALAIVSGQGYMQIAFLVSIVPAIVFFLFDRDWHIKPVWKEFLLAGGLAILLSGTFLVPLLHFFPNITKPDDPAFGTAQSLSNIPLSLVISDVTYYFNDVLKPVPFANLYIIYLGWIPILLAVLGIKFIPRKMNHVLIFILVSIGLIYLAASALPFKWLVKLIPNLGLIRYTSFFAGLANPLILCLSALGLQGLLNLKVPRLAVINTESEDHSTSRIIMNILGLVLFVCLVFGLISAYKFGQNWFYLIPNTPSIWQISDTLKTESTQWISIPYGEHYWNIPALNAGLKINNAFSAQEWKDRQLPGAYLEATRDPVDPADPNLVTIIDSINIVRHPENNYAYLTDATGSVIPCPATGLGGKVDVSCPEAPAGTLTVEEHFWNGWKAWQDGEHVSLLPGEWLNVNTSAGTHTYTFRYRPWDVWVGFVLTLAGIAGCVYFWRNSGKSI